MRKSNRYFIFSRMYEKLNNKLFTTIRMNRKKRAVGDVVKVYVSGVDWVRYCKIVRIEYKAIEEMSESLIIQDILHSENKKILEYGKGAVRIYFIEMLREWYNEVSSDTELFIFLLREDLEYKSDFCGNTKDLKEYEGGEA